jgi:hypothetical protein
MLVADLASSARTALKAEHFFSKAEIFALAAAAEGIPSTLEMHRTAVAAVARLVGFLNTPPLGRA